MFIETPNQFKMEPANRFSSFFFGEETLDDIFAAKVQSPVVLVFFCSNYGNEEAKIYEEGEPEAKVKMRRKNDVTKKNKN